jgi:hypothetical protein
VGLPSATPRVDQRLCASPDGPPASRPPTRSRPSRAGCGCQLFESPQAACAYSWISPLSRSRRCRHRRRPSADVMDCGPVRSFLRCPFELATGTGDLAGSSLRFTGGIRWVVVVPVGPTSTARSPSWWR